MNELLYLTIAEIRENLRAKEFSAEELTKAYLERIDETEGKVNAYLSVLGDEAIRVARVADERMRTGDQNFFPPPSGRPCSRERPPLYERNKDHLRFSFFRKF